jgi:hypothetical protein
MPRTRGRSVMGGWPGRDPSSATISNRRLGNHRPGPNRLRRGGRAITERPVEKSRGARILGAQSVHHPLAAALGANETAAFERLKMARRARLRESHLSRQLGHEAAAGVKQPDEPISGRLAETGELGAELLGGF